MKPILFIIALGAAAPGFAQLVTFDVANLTQSITNYVALTEQIANQATQISRQVEQIRQMETQLQRTGDMADFRRLVGFVEYHTDLRLPTQVSTWADRLARVDGRGFLGDTRGDVFRPVSVQFPDFDGARIDRDPLVYKHAHDIVVTVDEFKAVQSDVYTRREDLKRAIVRTSEAMQAATTEAEQQKLQAVIEAQYGQLAAVDAEVALSAAEVQVKAAEATAMNAAHDEADAETRRRLAQQEVRKISTAFTPTYDCLLRYVTERPLAH